MGSDCDDEYSKVSAIFETEVYSYSFTAPTSDEESENASSNAFPLLGSSNGSLSCYDIGWAEWHGMSCTYKDLNVIGVDWAGRSSMKDIDKRMEIEMDLKIDARL